ncbi:hypothetical protein EYM_02560 [Ignicoccus islandicus DSM 13165]|uniref:Uncharacterized protein n=1 Tax=Ignicoccus islandicus DSM 13165 TaxID=940295 RepID=A0A0U3FS58_9CREN|nr:hypothetical protein EYM_02560 [Ignicoccus islandicus DSM 13165]
MSASKVVDKASIVTALNGLGLTEENLKKEVEDELLEFMLKANAMPINLEVSSTFSEIIENVGQTVLEEAAERAEVLLELVNGNLSEELRAKLISLLTSDVADVLALIYESAGGDPSEVYVELANMGTLEEKARAAVATFAKVLLDSVRKEM